MDKPEARYKVLETVTLANLERQINWEADKGWKPILMSTTSTASTQTPIVATVILERESSG